MEGSHMIACAVTLAVQAVLPRICKARFIARWIECDMGTPVTMEDTAAHVHTITLWPSLKPSVCSMKPSEEKMMLMHRPAGAVSQDRRPASRNPVRQQAAERPKQAPACAMSRPPQCQACHSRCSPDEPSIPTANGIRALRTQQGTGIPCMCLCLVKRGAGALLSRSGACKWFPPAHPSC